MKFVAGVAGVAGVVGVVGGVVVGVVLVVVVVGQRCCTVFRVLLMSGKMTNSAPNL